MNKNKHSGCSMGGTIINTRLERYKSTRKYKALQKKIKKCSQCKKSYKGYCNEFKMRPSTPELANSCKVFEKKSTSKKSKTKNL